MFNYHIQNYSLLFNNKLTEKIIYAHQRKFIFTVNQNNNRNC